jgi:hypothetical protein
MSALSIQPTFPIFTGTDGLPLENGYIWIGTANLDPQGNPISVYWDAALTIPAGQPIRTLNGYPSRSGTPARIYVNSDYSIRVQDSKGSLVYSAPQATERISSDLVTYQPPFTGGVATTVQDKLSQTVSVKDFGAIGDGTTNDTAAIQAALTASKYVTFGDASDVYKVTATLTLQSGQSCVLGGATIRMYTSQTRMFNAVGASNVSIFGGVFIGFKNDFLNSSSSAAVCISLGTGSDNMVVENNKFYDFAYSPVSTVGYGKVLKFAFRNNIVVGPGATVLSDPNDRNCTGITIDGEYISIEGNKISESAQGLIVAAESKNISIANNIIFDTVNEHGMYVDAGCQDVAIIGNVVSNTGGIGIKFQWYDAGTTQEPSNLVISGNTIFNSGADGIQVLSTTTPPVIKKLNGCTISGNVIQDVGQDAILVRYVRNLTIADNTVLTAARYGIACTDTEIAVIDSNNITNTQSNGIFHNNTGDHVSVTNNTVVNPGLSGDNTNGNSSGILFGGGTGEGRTIAGNYVYGDETKTQYALYYTGGDQTKTKISGNSFLNTNDYPVRLKSPTQELAYWGENDCRSSTGQRLIVNLSNAVTRGLRDTFYADVQPSSGRWLQGDIVFNATPSAGGVIGWVCVAGGTPGTWKTFGAIAA